jgi:hypothetical protein
LKLLSDLVHDGKVQRAFVDDPHRLMDTYGLNAEDENALMRMDVETIGQTIANKLREHTFGYPTIRWPGRPREVRVFEPTSAVRGQQLQLHVRGEGFQRQAKLTLKHLGSSARIEARSTRVSGGYREAVLDAELTIGPDAPVGEYVVVVTNHEGAVPLTSFFPFQVKT